MSLPTPYYDKDGIVIYCGDNRRMLPELAGPVHGLLLTDPPYGLGLAHNLFTYQRGRMERKPWDGEPAPNWAIELALSLCVDAVIWGGNYYSLPPSRCWLSWYKPDAPPSMGNVEYAWTSLDQNSKQFCRSIAATNGERVGHPTQKPLPLISWVLEQVGDVDSVIDPWMGTGTTLVAAKLKGIPAIGIELEEDYCKLAVERLRQQVFSFPTPGAPIPGEQGAEGLTPDI